MSKVIPWDDFAASYYKTMNANQGRPKDARLVIGSLIIKHKLNLSSETTALQIQENPYFQYFVGFSKFNDDKPPFAPSLFVEIRKRMGKKIFVEFENTILEKIGKGRRESKESVKNKGKLLVDATVADQSVKYPIGINLLNEAREISEMLIDELYS